MTAQREILSGKMLVTHEEQEKQASGSEHGWPAEDRIYGNLCISVSRRETIAQNCFPQKTGLVTHY